MVDKLFCNIKTFRATKKILLSCWHVMQTYGNIVLLKKVIIRKNPSESSTNNFLSIWPKNYLMYLNQKCSCNCELWVSFRDHIDTKLLIIFQLQEIYNISNMSFIYSPISPTLVKLFLHLLHKTLDNHISCIRGYHPVTIQSNWIFSGNSILQYHQSEKFVIKWVLVHCKPRNIFLKWIQWRSISRKTE